MIIYHAGGGILGDKNLESEMFFYFAGTDYRANKDEKYEMNFYAAGNDVLGDNIGNKELEYVNRALKVGLRNRLLSFVDVDLVKGAFQFWLNPQLQDKKVFIDSGAFSAFTRGAKIDIKKYCDWLKQHLQEIEVYAGLDVIGDWQASAKNQDYMEAQGLKPLPTLQFKSPIAELERIVKKYEYFALGGLVPLSRSKPVLNAWLTKCWSVIKKYWPRKVHCLGITAQPILEKYPFYSCDSTAAIMGGGMGRVMDFVGGKLSHSDWVTELKEGHYQTADKDGKSAHLDRRIHNIKAMVAFEKYITELWKKRGIVWND